MSTLGKRLAKARKGTGKTQTELAETWGVTGSTIANWESGKTQEIPSQFRRAVGGFVGRYEKTLKGPNKKPAKKTVNPVAEEKPFDFIQGRFSGVDFRIEGRTLHKATINGETVK